MHYKFQTRVITPAHFILFLISFYLKNWELIQIGLVSLGFHTFIILILEIFLLVKKFDKK